MIACGLNQKCFLLNDLTIAKWILISFFTNSQLLLLLFSRLSTSYGRQQLASRLRRDAEMIE